MLRPVSSNTYLAHAAEGQGKHTAGAAHGKTLDSLPGPPHRPDLQSHQPYLLGRAPPFSRRMNVGACWLLCLLVF